MDTLTFKSSINRITKNENFQKIGDLQELEKEIQTKNGGKVYFSICNCVYKGALFVPLWKTR